MRLMNEFRRGDRPLSLSAARGRLIGGSGKGDSNRWIEAIVEWPEGELIVGVIDSYLFMRSFAERCRSGVAGLREAD